VVKEVRVHDRRTIEVWFASPNPERFECWNKWLHECNSIRRRDRTQTEVWFRIRHAALDGGDGASRASYCDQGVEVTLGPNGAFKKGNLGTLTRQVAADQVVNSLPEPRGRPTPPKKPKTPRVVELLQMALEWQRQLDAGEAVPQAAIARREGITRARVTQIMAMLRLAPEIREHIARMPDVVNRPAISERALRPIVRLEAFSDQRTQFRKLTEGVERSSSLKREQNQG
jgi:hypothetical protein